jgi:integrase
MALYKRGKTWHTDFSVDGQRFRQGLDTTDWREAQARERELIGQASEGKLTPKTHEFSRLGFSDAAERHLRDRLPSLAERSIQTEQERLKPLRAYFGNAPLFRILPDTIRAYISERKNAGAANKTINLELGVVRGVLKRAKRWHFFGDEIKPLPVRHQVGRALSPEEKFALQQAAGNNLAWQNARLAMSLALNTTMRSCEVKGLQWRDVDFLERTITVRQSKTDAGRRLIPMNDEAFESIMELYHRAQTVLGTEPDHFLFPACENGKIDPANPQKSWRTAWRSLRKAAGLKDLRFHDLRHHAITELAESQASERTIMSLAGHVSRQMLEHYSHIRLDAKRQAVEALSQRGKPGGHVTKHVTRGVTDDQLESITPRKDWSGREDLNLRPPGPELGCPEPISLLFNYLSGASTVSFLLNHASFGLM